MITIYVMTKTQNRPSRYGNGWQHVTKNVEVYNENRSEKMKYNSTINRVKLT